MKKLIILSLMTLTFKSFAGTDSMIEIQGVIGSTFDKNSVQVYDTLDQTYFLPRTVFAKDMRIAAGVPFVVEVDEKMYDSLDIKPSDKKIKVQITLEKKDK